MTGSIAEAYYGMTKDWEDKALKYMSDDLKRIYFAFEKLKKKRIERK